MVDEAFDLISKKELHLSESVMLKNRFQLVRDLEIKIHALPFEEVKDEEIDVTMQKQNMKQAS